jgi:hypothetical protein
MSIGKHIGVVAAASLALIVSAMARTGEDAAGTTPAQPSDVTIKEQPAPAPAPVNPPAGMQRFQGGGGVGFAGPNLQRQVAMIQRLLNADDDAWQKLSPKVEKVLVAKQAMSTGAGMNWTSHNNQPPVVQPSTAKPDTAPGKALQAVRDAVTDEKASDDVLAKSMAVVRDAKKIARAEYDAAQKELIDATTPRQQAILMTLGVVE